MVQYNFAPHPPFKIDQINWLLYFISGRWFCVKRQLPSSGKYDLESYLPVFLFKRKCDRLGNIYFWEIIRIIAKHQAAIMSSLDTILDEDVEANI